MYEVINFFTDLQDNEHPYNVGDKFPREGKTVSNDRLIELSGSGNLQHKPLIKKIAGNVAKEPTERAVTEPNEKQYTKTDIKKMPKEQLLEMGIRLGVVGADGMTGEELKEQILGILGL